MRARAPCGDWGVMGYFLSGLKRLCGGLVCASYRYTYDSLVENFLRDSILPGSPKQPIPSGPLTHHPGDRRVIHVIS